MTNSGTHTPMVAITMDIPSNKLPRLTAEVTPSSTPTTSDSSTARIPMRAEIGKPRSIRSLTCTLEFL